MDKTYTDQTEPIRLEKSAIEFARLHKKATGLPISRFIEDAINEKVERLPKDVIIKMGLNPVKKSL